MMSGKGSIKTSKMYNNIRLEHNVFQSKQSKEMWKNPKIRDKLISQKIGRKNTSATRLKMSESAKIRHKEKPISSEIRKGIALKLTNRRLSEKHIENIRKGSIGIKKPGTAAKLKHVKKEQVQCPHCNKYGGKPVMMRYHFDKCKENLND